MPNNNGNHSPQPAERRGRIGGTSWHHFAQLTFPLRRNGTECAAEAGQAGDGLWRVPGGALAGGTTEAAPPPAGALTPHARGSARALPQRQSGQVLGRRPPVRLRGVAVRVAATAAPPPRLVHLGGWLLCNTPPMKGRLDRS